MQKLSWIAADWGTTRLRVWAIGRDQSILARAHSDKGMNALAPGGFEGALLELVGGWLPGDRRALVIACGMVGARQGWAEADYARIPARPLASNQFTEAPVADPRLRVLIIPGLARSGPADVMRGEETQIAGLLAERPGFEGAVCMPGTHSKWVVVSNGRVIDFRTCMTGELFALLERHSILRHSLQSQGLEQGAFEEAVTEALEAPEQVIANLFSIRAEDLVAEARPGAARAKLSGWLIAAEIHAARALWRDRRVVLLGSEELAALYATALRCAGAEAEIVDGAGLTIGGLIAARAMVKETGDA